MPAIRLDSLDARSIQGRADEAKDSAYIAALIVLGPLVLVLAFAALVYRRWNSSSSKKLMEVSADFQKHQNDAKAEEARIQALLDSANAANRVVERENRRLRRMASRLPVLVPPSAKSPPSGNSGEGETYHDLFEHPPSGDDARERSSFEPIHNGPRPLPSHRSLRQSEPFELGGTQENLPNEATEISEHSPKPTQGTRQHIVRESFLSDPNKARKERLGGGDEEQQRPDLEWDNVDLDEDATVWPFQGDDTDLESCYSMGTVLSAPEVNQVNEPKKARIASPTMDQVLARERETRVRIVEP
ncbi:hypothetical protein BGZ61DRAFT_560923 [Ilyonectria robusta]|uniref:uncharacterized protein n=1 Tax=Ilyonectria robusta TaxID=1079257 RepID=UPI001E8E07F1|nr:uncharacterized protein BGZ61DRAFT_560923 [Ilyonectria robusta]KAH8735180.1 hypothetical protein BGZ61DRAFT_560923 [Ilyonectria robusta]